MGLGGISAWQLLLIFVILVVALATIPLRHRGDSESPDDEEDTGPDSGPEAEPYEDDPGGGDAEPPRDRH